MLSPLIIESYGTASIAFMPNSMCDADIYSGTGISAAMGLTTAQTSYDFTSTGVLTMPAGAIHPVLRWQIAN